jgi:hypothetical protein
MTCEEMFRIVRSAIVRDARSLAPYARGRYVSLFFITLLEIHRRSER